MKIWGLYSSVKAESVQTPPPVDQQEGTAEENNDTVHLFPRDLMSDDFQLRQQVVVISCSS